MTQRKAGRPEELLPGPPVAGHHIRRDAQAGALLIDRTLVSCTPTEYKLFVLLLEQAEHCVTYAQLIARVSEEPLSEAAAFRQAKNRVIHQVSGLRPKIWPCGLDIVSVMGVGYILLSSHAEEGVSPPGAAERLEPKGW